MATVVVELYQALKQAGVEEKMAQAAAAAVLVREDLPHLATIEDIGALKVSLAELKVDLLKWVVGLLVAQTAIIAGLIRMLAK